jgi:hypothetical protein
MESFADAIYKDFTESTICLVVVCMAGLTNMSGNDFAHGCISSLSYRLRQSQIKNEVT